MSMCVKLKVTSIGLASLLNFTGRSILGKVGSSSYLSPLKYYCEAQGKGRAKGRPRKVTERSFIDMDGGWWLSFP